MTISKNLNFLSLINLNPYETSDDETYLNKKQKAHFKVLLQSLKKYIEDSIKKEDNSITLNSNLSNLADPFDRATQEEALILDVKKKDRQVILIKNIIDTLKRIETNEFGYCKNCDEEIGIKRLEASPTTRLCIDCQKIIEIQERRLYTNNKREKL